MAGLTPQGFEIKTVADLIAAFEQTQLDLISPTLDMQPTALLGVLNGVVGQAGADVWEVLQLLYSGMDPDAAGDDQLTSVSLITGTLRRDATPTLVLGVQVTVAASFHADAGTMIAAIENNAAAQFFNRAAVDNPLGTPQTVTVDFEAFVKGPQQCLAGTLNVIAVPLAGWSVVTNPDDGVVGTDIETDPPLRQRRNAELSAPGSATADAIRADILEQLPKTRSCRVLFNNTETTDGLGLPPHTIEAIAYLPGATTDDDIALAQLILNDKSAGTGTHGTSSQTVKDSQGNEETIFFTRPSDVNIYIDITVTTNPKTFPADGADRIKAALVAYGAAEIGPGDTIYVQALKASVFPSPTDPNVGVLGVLDVTVFKVDTHSSPTNTANLTFTQRQLAVLDTARINVTVT